MDSGLRLGGLGLVLASVGLLAPGCGDEAPRDDANADGGPGLVTLSATDGMTSGDGDGDGDGETGVKLDVGSADTEGMPGDGCAGDGGGGNGGGGGMGEGDLELSYIWIANTSQATISKIDTATMIEEGRYAAKPSGGDPSRTSVNLQGDVAVANRNGGVAKFYADSASCPDTNGIPGIQTSSGGADVLPWGEDECLAWYTELICGSNRPAAWTRGEWNQAECSYTGSNLWTVCDSNVHLLDGETGAILQTIPIPGGNSFVYGGAADGESNFWGLDLGTAQLFRVDADDFTLQQWPLSQFGGYGITVDANGRPWVCGGGGVARFNVDSATWDISGSSGIGGCMTDGESLIWHSNGSGMLLGYDIDSLQVVEQVQLPEYVHGVSIDFQGHVWGVSFAGSNAYRADPITDVVDTFPNLVGAYTYSDMTGFALSSAGTIDPPAG